MDWHKLFDFDDIAANGAITNAAVAIAEALSGEYGQPLVGRTRMVFVDRVQGVVYKLPLNYEGISANQLEAQSSLRQRESAESAYVPIAPCELLLDKDIDLVADRSSDSGIPILKMEYLQSVEIPISEMPTWVQSVDCAQVGIDQHGDLLAFDL